MSAYINNDPSQFELLNLKINPDGKGPYLVRQEGVDGKSMDLKVGRYLLCKDGTWTLGLKVATMPDEEKREYFFKDFDEVYKFLDTLTGKAVVDSSLPKGKTPEELMAAAEDMIDRVWKAVKDAKGTRVGEAIEVVSASGKELKQLAVDTARPGRGMLSLRWNHFYFILEDRVLEFARLGKK